MGLWHVAWLAFYVDCWRYKSLDKIPYSTATTSSMGSLDNSTTSKRYTAVIFDLGDVLFTWSLSTPTPKTLKSIFRSVHWLEYEKGNLTQDETYSLVAQQFCVSTVDIKNSVEAARSTFQIDRKVLEVIRELKTSGLELYVMSNMSAPDWEFVSTKCTSEEWAMFNQIFIS